MVSELAVDADSVTFVLADPHHLLRHVRLAQERGLHDGQVFHFDHGSWRLQVPRPAVRRMEYLFAIEDQNGNRSTITDPANPFKSPGAFGEKSEVRFPGYHEPSWLSLPIAPDSARTLQSSTRLRGEPVRIRVWASDGLGTDPAPLLLVHDGPEYAAYGSLLRYLGALIRSGGLPPLRAALLDPGERNAWYSASESYSEVLATDVLPKLESLATVRIGVGASLGALAMLHAHWRRPALLDGLFLQSGSFFTAELDPQERDFSGFEAVTAFVRDISTAAVTASQVPTVLTCGTVEENLANNQKMAAALAGLGYPAELHEVPDAHNYTGWRDALDPHLTNLINKLGETNAT